MDPGVQEGAEVRVPPGEQVDGGPPCPRDGAVVVHVKEGDLVHPPPQDHEVSVEELQVLVHVVHEDGVGCAGGYRVDVPDEGVAPVCHRVHEAVNHPSVKGDLGHVVLRVGGGREEEG